MTTFLLKINCELHLNGADPRPTVALQWEAATVTILPPQKLEGGPGGIVAPGDVLIMWTHEDPGFGNGQGLTATATARAVAGHGDTLDVVMRDVKLVSPHVRLNDQPRGPSGSVLLDYLKGHRHRRTIEVSDEDVSKFWDALGAAYRKKQTLIATYTQSMAKSAEEEALETDRQKIAEGFERRFAS